MEVIRIEGVEFKVEDAREFVERALIYAKANPPVSPERQRAIALAGQIYACLRGKGPCDVTLDEKVVASAVLAEWLQSYDAPEAARTLYNAFASARLARVIDTQELERRMRPGAWSDGGFLGPDERLEDVLRADRQTLEELDLGPGELADTLDCLLGAWSARTLIELANADAGVLDSVEEGRDMEKAVQEAVVSVTEAEQRFGPVEPCQLSLTLLLARASSRNPQPPVRVPRRSTGVLIDRRFEVLMTVTAGWQECPWSPTQLFGGGGQPCATGSRDWGIRDRQRGLEMRGPELITHLIREHGFFEGFESPYRVDPRALAELLQLGPFTEPT